MKWNVLALAVTAVLAGCSSTYPRPDLSTQERISDEMARVSAASKNAANATKVGQAPVAVPSAVLGALVQSPDALNNVPAGRTVRSVSSQRFDLVVSDAPIGQVLSGLVEGTEYSIMLKSASEASTVAAATAAPGGSSAVSTQAVDVSGKRVSFKLKNITLFEALDAIRDVYGYDYTVEGRRILVQPAELQTRLFYVNYILGQRRGVSDIQVIGGASVGGSSSSTVGASTSSSSSYGSVQASGLSTAVKSDVWGEAEDALRTLLGCNVAKAAATNIVVPRVAGTGANASRADVSFPGDQQMAERQRGVDGCTQGRALAISAMSGSIMVRAMPTELRMVERVLRNMQLSISRQVIIESKIIDVELNNSSQQGINWSLFNQGMHRMSFGGNPSALGVNQPGTPGQPGGTVNASTLAGLLNTNASSGVPVGGVGGLALQATNFAALINFMESQGRVHVLSSPRIATLNNQKAVIKVGSEEPFVTNIVGGTTTVGTAGLPTVVPPNLTYQPFFAGIALDVTPQIDAEDNITLHVHSMVNRVVEKDKMALTGANGGTSIMVPFAVNSMNETDSVVKARDGQVVVIGGLMSERTSDVRGGVPVARDVPLAGSLFSSGSQQSSKRELVILIKPIVVKDDTTWSNMISESEDRISGLKTVPAAPR